MELKSWMMPTTSSSTTSSNRTFMELKYYHDIEKMLGMQGSNRTFMELKSKG